ncbi:glycoside hydrolase family 9 protein [Nocardia sp. NRRL S-836]|uniref:glycoside hydrolase family 9 protein n=1 Tax=Nocardia sp. NRRL S-836 TaxID=1519492 RepID=UPI0006AEBE90|nr:glycoside hydrolase family 9 protein [Nocardia sp. NRRL S-836]KOV83178.1 endoglucanase [Nocardia sp. NRRL S-836]
MRSQPPRLLAAALLTALAATAIPAAGTAEAAEYERVLNGKFDSGSADPWWSSAGVTNRITGGELCASVTGGTTNPWDALVGQNGVPFESGQSYTLSFDAHATTAQPVAAAAGESVSPYRGIARQEFAVTPTKQHFTFSFTSTLDFPDAGNGQVAFQLGGQTADNTICVDNVSLVGGVKPPGGVVPNPTRKVQVDQVGYVPGLPKRATLVSTATTPQTWTLKNSAGATVASGQSTPKGADATSGDSVHSIDFSSFDTPGTGYTLVVGTDSSFPFDISADVVKKLRYDALAFFYHQRSGTPIEAQYVGDQYARPAGHINVAPNQGDNNVPCRADLACGYTLDVRGGWYDAGDHGKYVVNGGISAWQLLNSYERAARIGDASAFRDGTLAIPEKANGVPDLLDEARWEVDFLLKMQAPDGMAHHKVHDANWTALPTRPELDDQPRRLSATSTAATLNLAAVAAQASRLWKSVDATYSAKLLTAARKAYAAAKANPNKIADPNDGTGGGAYSDNTVSDEFYWAAAELYATTGESAYGTDVTSSPHYKAASLTRAGFYWGGTAPLGDITLALVPTGLPAADVTAIKTAFATVADQHLAAMAQMGYATPYDNSVDGYVWGSNSAVLNNAQVLALAHDFTGADKYRDGVFEALHYLLGRNPLSTSYVAGYGEQAVQNVHHRFWAKQNDPTLPIAPPGSLSGGPNSGLQDPIVQRLLPGCPQQKCWVDDIGAYSVNEVAVNWNSALAWVSGWAAEKSGKPPVPVADCEVTFTANRWSSGLSANVAVKNTGTTAWTSWKLGFALPGTQQVTAGWSANWSQTGRDVTATNMSWNGKVEAGKSVYIGFNASGAGGDPTAFTINGKSCKTG